MTSDDERGLRNLDSVRQAVERYPDDPDFWFSLGDTYFHMSDHVLVDLDEVERVFSRALALDPDFTGFYQHPLDLAFWQGDSTRIASLIQAYGTGYDYASEDRTVFLIAFGDAADRARSLAFFDTLPFREALFNGGYLLHARFGRIQEEFLRRILARPDALPDGRQYLYYNLLQRGRLRVALEYLENSPWPGSGPREAYLYRLFEPDPGRILEGIEGYLSQSLKTGDTVDEDPRMRVGVGISIPVPTRPIVAAGLTTSRRSIGCAPTREGCARPETRSPPTSTGSPPGR